MRKFFLCLLAFFSFSFGFSFSSDDIEVFTLENGLKCFVLSDYSSATIRMEMVVKAGYSFQNEKNAGFFPFYAHLIDGEINADTVRILKNSSPNEFEKNLSELKKNLLPLTASNSELEREFRAMKETVNEYASSVSGFINTSIDARVFEREPWRTESGVYPSLFSKNSIENVRTILDEIQKNHYNPNNSFLFVSGNVSKKIAKEKIDAILGSLRRSENFDKENNRKINNDSKNADSKKELQKENLKNESSLSGTSKNIKKYVLVDSEFSQDLSQVVVQFTDFDKRECDVLSKIFNEYNSQIKKNIINGNEAKIGLKDEYYLNFASSLTIDSSRLIVQTLLEKTKNSIVSQSENFAEKLLFPFGNELKDDEKSAENLNLKNGERRNSILPFSAERRLRQNYEKQFYRVKDESSSLMELLASWVVINETSDIAPFFDNCGSFSPFTKEELSELEEKFYSADAKVFLLVSDAVFAKNKKEFSKKGWETVTKKNGSWYTSSLFEKKLKEESDKKIEEYKAAALDGERNYKNYILSAKKSFSDFTLNNGIPLTIKKDETKETASFTIYVNCGEVEFAENKPYLWGILTNCFAQNIRKELAIREKSGVFKGTYDVDVKNNNFYSTITVSCLSDDLNSVIEASGKALVFGEITPVLADGFIYNARANFRIKNGTPDFQLLSEAVQEFYPESKLKKLYPGNKVDDVLENIKFQEIDAAYTTLLDSSKFHLIVCGGVFDTRIIVSNLNRTFGILEKIPENENFDNAVSVNEKNVLDGKTVSDGKKARRSENGTNKNTLSLFEKETGKLSDKISNGKISKKVLIKHQFFTDVSADKAGPRPLVLVPTKNFYDPVLYVFPNQIFDGKKSAYFFEKIKTQSLREALLLEILQRLKIELKKSNKINLSLSDDELGFSSICVFHVERLSVVEKAFGRVLSKLHEDLESLCSKSDLIDFKGEIDYVQKSPLLLELENLWMTEFLKDTGSNSGFSALIASGLSKKNNQWYLDAYTSVCEATGEDYLKVFNAFFNEECVSRFYSRDTKQ